MDVTQEVNLKRMTMGGSGSSNRDYLSSNRTLDFAKSSNSLINPTSQRITQIPQSINYKDTVGLFGAENIFIKIDLDVLTGNKVFDKNGITVNTYEAAYIDNEDPVTDPYYDTAIIDYNLDLVTVNTYDPATMSASIEIIPNPLVRVDLTNLKTGNKYIDAWFDTRLYTKDKKEYEYEVMYINPKSYFYIGFHARNTKRLPYNVRMTVGDQFLSEYDLTTEQRRFLVS